MHVGNKIKSHSIVATTLSVFDHLFLIHKCDYLLEQNSYVTPVALPLCFSSNLTSLVAIFYTGNRRLATNFVLHSKVQPQQPKN